MQRSALCGLGIPAGPASWHLARALDLSSLRLLTAGTLCLRGVRSRWLQVTPSTPISRVVFSLEGEAVAVTLPP